MEFNEYQAKAKITDQRKKKDEINLVIPLLGLIGETGSVAAEHKKRLRDGQAYSDFSERFKEELGDVLWYVAVLADDIGISLEDVAEYNLWKTDDRWGKLRPLELYDKDFPNEEQLPREATFEFRVNADGKIEILIDGIKAGDPLSDNAYEDDGYRFHDAFHLSYMAVLGWSPVMRKLLKKKRKSEAIVDEVEDGARAQIIEEAISAMVYEHAKGRNFYEGVKVVDFGILTTIKGMVTNFEVKNLRSSDWEAAILAGFEVYRQLRENNGGKVFVNLEKRTIRFLC